MTKSLMAQNNKPISKRVKFGQILSSSDPNILFEPNDSGSGSNSSCRLSNASDFTATGEASPRLSSYTNDDDNNSNPTSSPFYYAVSPWNQATSSPYIKSPWIKLSPYNNNNTNNNNNHQTNVYYSRGRNCHVGSLVREEGHVYSLAVRAGVLYTGSESKNIRVWRDLHESGGFKCGSGLVKAIIISDNYSKVFTGHQDGKIRVWTENGKRVGTLPTLKDLFKSSVNPRNYVEVRRHKKVPRIKHYDAVSCLCLNEPGGVLYSASWDKTIKVWRVKDGRCLESIDAHDDAINSIVVGFGGLLFSGSADGSVKVWRRELLGRNARHFHVKTLLDQENAVTSLAVADGGGGGTAVLYSGSSDGLVNFWLRVKEEEEVVYGGVLRGHKLAVLCLGIAGCLVFSGSADKSICVWKREEGDGGVHSCLAVLSGHEGPVKCLAIEQDHRHETDHDDDLDDRQWIVYSGSLDKSVKIWRVGEHTLLDDESTDGSSSPSFT